MAGLAISNTLAAESFIPNDPYFFTGNPPGFPGQWHLDKQTSGAVVDVNIRGAWERGLTGEGVTIGVLETGFDYTNPDLAPNYSAADSWDFFDNDSDPRETNNPPNASGFDAHAAAVAGIAAARGGNSLGVTGAAPFASVASLRWSKTNLMTRHCGNTWPMPSPIAPSRLTSRI